MNLFCLNKFYDNEEIVVVVLGIFNDRNVDAAISLSFSVCKCWLTWRTNIFKFPKLTS